MIKTMKNTRQRELLETVSDWKKNEYHEERRRNRHSKLHETE